jgi:HNH endonuclease
VTARRPYSGKDPHGANAIASAARKGRSQPFSWGKAKDAYPENWPDITAVLKKAANYRCANCPTRSPPPFAALLHVHHKRSAARFLSATEAADVRNLIVLCGRCHSTYHKHMRG